MVGKLVPFQVLTHIAIGPIEERMHLVTPTLELDRCDLSASLGLDSAKPREPCLGSEFPQCPVQGLLLVDPIVPLDALEPLIPEFAEPGFLPRRRGIGTE